MYPEAHSHFITRATCSRSSPSLPVCDTWALLLRWADDEWWSGRLGWPWVHLTGRLLACMEAPGCCLAGPDRRRLAAGPQGLAGLVLAHWYAESGSRRLWGWCLPFK